MIDDEAINNSEETTDKTTDKTTEEITPGRARFLRTVNKIKIQAQARRLGVRENKIVVRLLRLSKYTGFIDKEADLRWLFENFRSYYTSRLFYKPVSERSMAIVANNISTSKSFSEFNKLCSTLTESRAAMIIHIASKTYVVHNFVLNDPVGYTFIAYREPSKDFTVYYLSLEAFVNSLEQSGYPIYNAN